MRENRVLKGKRRLLEGDEQDDKREKERRTKERTE